MKKIELKDWVKNKNQKSSEEIKYPLSNYSPYDEDDYEYNEYWNRFGFVY